MLNQISNAKSNLDFQISISMRHLSNAYDIYGEFQIRIYRVKFDWIWHLSQITRSAKYAEILSGFWGFCFRILGITQDFGDTAYSGFCFMFEYTRNILFDLFSNIVTGRWLLLTVSWLGLKLESYGSISHFRISRFNFAVWNSAFWNSAF